MLSRNVDIVGILGGVGGAAVGAGILETGEMDTLNVVQRVALVGVALCKWTIIPA